MKQKSHAESNILALSTVDIRKEHTFSLFFEMTKNYLPNKDSPFASKLFL